MHALVFGAKGQLGRDLVVCCSDAGRVTAFAHGELDIADVDAVRRAVDRCSPDILINAAAYTNVEGAEDDREAAFRVNENGARNVALVAADAGVPVVYYSTDFVFGGAQSTPYEPDDPLALSGVYAESKAAGEAAVREACPRHFIVRTAWVYGPGGANFVEKIIAAARTRPALKVVTDEIGSPTHTLDLAKATLALANTEAYGTYHAVDAGSCSRFDFAHAILARADLDTPIEPCLAEEFPSKAPRPKYSVLSNAKLEAASGYAMPDWEAALDQYFQRREELS